MTCVTTRTTTTRQQLRQRRPTSPFSTNICAGQTARFLEQTGLDMVTLTCAEAAGEGPLQRVAPQTGGVSEEELYYISYVVK